jgi:IPT/TIG domain/S-layer homology domain
MRTTRPGRFAGLAFAFASLSSAVFAMTFTVTTTADSGAGSLRQAILDANANSGADTIEFNIIGSGVQTIAPATPLPTITDGVTIDGYTQPGTSANTNGPTLGTNAVILIELDGTNAGTGSDSAILFFGPASGGSAVRGLAINRAHYAGIRVSGVTGMVIEGNFIGTDPAGAVPHGNTNFGILCNNGPSNVTIGGTTPAARNLISGNGTNGINLGSGGNGGTGHLIQGNLIGTDATGDNAIAGAQTGVELGSASANVTVGGTSPASRNVISGNGGYGVRVRSGTGLVVSGNFIGTDVTGMGPLGNINYGILVEANGSTIGGSAPGAGNVISANAIDGMSIAGQVMGVIIQGNFVGTDATGTFALGNQNRGISVFGGNTIIGGIGPGEGNVVAHSGIGGVDIFGGSGNTIRGNSIYANGTIGIDLAGDGVTANDALDADTGSNGLQNYPLMSSAVPLSPSGTEVVGTLDSTPSTTYALDFYANPVCAGRPHDFEEGLLYIGTTNLSTDGAGHAAYDVTLAYTIEVGQPVTVTATDPAGNTSELSPRIVFSVSPVSGPSPAGTLFAVRGTNFAPGATITLGGIPATDFFFQNSTQVEARTPLLPAGTLSDVTLTNLDGSSGTLSKGWVTDFLDVPQNNTFHSYVTTLVANGITAGQGGGMYGVAATTLRQQMAVFLLKAKYGICYVPPPCTPGFFTDVTCPGTFAPWIEALATLGITGGCGPTTYCPTNPVRRDQMAVFLLKTEHGSSYVPPQCVGAGVFFDVPCTPGVGFPDWIERLAAEMITTGCGGGNYCPLSPNTRGQMAVFIVKTFNLQ